MKKTKFKVQYQITLSEKEREFLKDVIYWAARDQGTGQEDHNKKAFERIIKFSKKHLKWTPE